MLRSTETDDSALNNFLSQPSNGPLGLPRERHKVVEYGLLPHRFGDKDHERWFDAQAGQTPNERREWRSHGTRLALFMSAPLKDMDRLPPKGYGTETSRVVTAYLNRYPQRFREALTYKLQERSCRYNLHTALGQHVAF